MERYPFSTKENPFFVAETSFLSLWGRSSSLPHTYMDWMSKESRQQRTILTDFLDIFSNRLNHLFFKIQKKFYPYLDWSLPDQTDIGQLLLSFAGMRDQSCHLLPPRHFLVLSHFFWKKPRNSQNLGRILGIYLGKNVSVLSFKGGFRQLPETILTQIGNPGKNNELGNNFLLGKRAWLQNQALEVCLALGDVPGFHELFPGGSLWEKVKALVASYVGCGSKVFLSLSFTFSSPKILGSPTNGFYLGWSAVLGQQKRPLSVHFSKPLLD